MTMNTRATLGSETAVHVKIKKDFKQMQEKWKLGTKVWAQERFIIPDKEPLGWILMGAEPGEAGLFKLTNAV